MFHPVKSVNVKDFKGYKLVVVSSCYAFTHCVVSACSCVATTQPCVSVGNVAQLTSDLLITTLKMKCVGYLYDQCLLPLVCQSAFDHNSGVLSTSAEGVFVYHVIIT